MAKLRPGISKLCRVRTYADIEEMMNLAIEVEQVLGDLRGNYFWALERGKGWWYDRREHQHRIKLLVSKLEARKEPIQIPLAVQADAKGIVRAKTSSK